MRELGAGCQMETCPYRKDVHILEEATSRPGKKAEKGEYHSCQSKDKGKYGCEAHGYEDNLIQLSI